MAETTSFNKLRVLQGNPADKYAREVTISEAYEATRMVQYDNVEVTIPSWLQVDDNMELHDYTGTQDVTGIMPWDEGDNHYYDPEHTDDPLAQGRTWMGEWNPGIEDNVTAKIDFSGLKDSQSLDELYNNLADLVGCSTGIPCGTCNEIFYGICFSGGTAGVFRRC